MANRARFVVDAVLDTQEFNFVKEIAGVLYNGASATALPADRQPGEELILVAVTAGLSRENTADDFVYGFYGASGWARLVDNDEVSPDQSTVYRPIHTRGDEIAPGQIGRLFGTQVYVEITDIVLDYFQGEIVHADGESVTFMRAESHETTTSPWLMIDSIHEVIEPEA